MAILDAPISLLTTTDLFNELEKMIGKQSIVSHKREVYKVNNVNDSLEMREKMRHTDGKRERERERENRGSQRAGSSQSGAAGANSSTVNYTAIQAETRPLTVASECARTVAG